MDYSKFIPLFYNYNNINFDSKEQFINGVIESDDYYNTWIQVKVHRSHLKNLQEK
mgnify:CR=1 FL=1